MAASPPLRLVFMGTADIACPTLNALLQKPGWQVVAVVTQPDRPKGRHLKPRPPAIKELALESNLPVVQPARARNPEFIAELTALKPNLIVVMAYGQIIPQAILDLPQFGCLNVHTSLLPKYRGAAPIQWALLNDENETGATIMKMDAGLDTGAILSQESTLIRPDDNAQTLHDRLAEMGAKLLVKTIPDYIAGKITPQPQPDECDTYARKITKEDGLLDWTRPARVLWNRVRAFTPWPGAFTHIDLRAQGREQEPPGRTLLKIWEAEPLDSLKGEPGEILSADKKGLVIACGQNALRILRLQLEGGRRMTAPEFLAGHSLQPGRIL